MKVDYNKYRQIRYLNSKHVTIRFAEFTSITDESIMDFFNLFSYYEMHNLTKCLNATDNRTESKEKDQILADWKRFKEVTDVTWTYNRIVKEVSISYKSINDFIISWIEGGISKSFYEYFITLNSNMRIGLYMDLIRNHNIPLYSQES